MELPIRYAGHVGRNESQKAYINRERPFSWRTVMPSNSWKSATTFAFLLFVLLISLFTKIAVAATLKLDIQTDKTSYDLEETVTIYGNLTKDGLIVQDGFVAIQIRDPFCRTVLLRTPVTGSGPTAPVLVELLEIFPCDDVGNPKYSFARGDYLGLKATVRNNASSQHVVVIAYIQFSNDVPFTTYTIFNQTIESGKTVSKFVHPVAKIPAGAPTGITKIFGNTLTDLPENSGYPLCPEKITSFNIRTSTSSSASGITQEANMAISGSFNLSMSLEGNGLLGDFTVYATSLYGYPIPQPAANQTIFKVILLADINGDGKVDMVDLWLVAKAFGSYPGYPNWNPQADVDGNGKVDMIDIWIVAKSFGKP
jgi:hypothetical protein